MKVREAIRKAVRYGSFMLYTGNGTQIRLLDICNSPYDCIGKIKVVKGERIYRDIFCAVTKAPETQHMDVIERYSMYVPDDNGCSYFCDDEYTIPEKDMNLFISLNGGIDEYRTISLPAMMMSDASLIFGLG